MFVDPAEDRICLEQGCDRLSSDVVVVCGKHADNCSVHVDALEVLQDPVGQVPDWFEVTLARSSHLAAVLTSRPRWWKRKAYERRIRDAARTEYHYITALSIVHAVSAILDDAQQVHALSPWRMPPDGLIYKEMTRRQPHLLPALGLNDSFVLSPVATTALAAALQHFGLDVRVVSCASIRTLDAIARALREHRNPTPPPFLPITHRRALCKEHASVLEYQEQRNLPYLPPHAPHLLAHKSHIRKLPAHVFQDPNLDLSVPNGLVAYHQVGIPEKLESPRCRRLDRVVKRHLELAEGDVVRYRHTRSATLSTRWHPGLGYERPNSLNTPSTENALRLELAPKRGLYFGEQASSLSGAIPIQERELVLPPHTTWRVIGIRDVIQPDHYEKSMPPDLRIRSDDRDDRLRAILMVEIDEHEIPPGDQVIDMTEPFDRPVHPPQADEY